MANRILTEDDLYCITENNLEFGIFKDYAQGLNRKLVILHHIDMDGIFAARIVADAVSNYIANNVKPVIEFVPYNYEKQYDFSEVISKKDDVIAVDLSLKADQIKNIAKISNRFLFIDHHISSIRAINSLMKFVKGKVIDKTFAFDVDIRGSGTRLAYDLVKNYTSIYGTTYSEGVNENVVDLIDRYDRWVFDSTTEEGRKCLYFNQYIDRSYQLNIHSPFISKVLAFTDDELTEALEYGKKLFDIAAQENEVKMQAFGYEDTVDFNGDKYKTYVGYGPGNSAMFGKRFNDYDFVTRKYYHRNGLSTSLYTHRDDIDVSKIAEKYNGGGHKQAAGYTCKF